MRASLTLPHRPGVEDSIMSRVGNLGDQIWLHQKYKRQNFITTTVASAVKRADELVAIKPIKPIFYDADDKRLSV